MSAETTVRRYFTCLDEEDWDGMRELWTPDGRLHAVGARQRSGIDEIVSYFSRIFEPWTTHRDEPTRLLLCDDAIVAEVLFTGTTPDGRTVTFEAIDVFDLAGDRIAALSNWYDIAYARRELAL